MRARLLPLLNGRWVIEVTTDEGDPIDSDFIVALSASKLSARTVGGCILVEAAETRD